jgi:anti-anti-sigma factor
MAGEILSATIAHDGRSSTVELSGELDMSSAPEVLRCHESLPPDQPITIDLRGLTFMDSTGLSTLIRISADRPELRLVAGPPPVQKVFEITNMTDHFDWLDPGSEAAV